MNHRNLIPTRRLVAKHRTAVIRRWIAINVAYLFILLAAGAAYIFSGYASEAHRDTGPALVAAENFSQKLAALRTETVALRASRQSIAEVSTPPDWSILLSALATSLDDDVVLSAIDSTAGASAGERSHMIRLGGIGRSSKAVADFVLRVERLRFFTRVQLVQTAPQSLQGTEGVGFQLACTLPDAGGGK